MRLSDYTRKLLDLAGTVHRWLGAIAALDERRREKVARYAEQIAETLARAANALARLEAKPGDRAAARLAEREFGRITGYVETILDVLEHHLDGRKLAGLKRRLELLASYDPAAGAPLEGDGKHIHRLVAAEGYFRALADGLRA